MNKLYYELPFKAYQKVFENILYELRNKRITFELEYSHIIKWEDFFLIVHYITKKIV